MTTWIALLRGVNVGGNNKIIMKQLVEVMKKDSFENVKTYIQSGNIICDYEAERHDVQAKIATLIEQQFGFMPKIMVRTIDEIQSSLVQNPFPQALENGKTLHILYMDEEPTNMDWERLAALRKPTESYQLIDNCFYLYTPDGFGTSKLAEKIESILKVKTTGRNLNTIRKLIDLTKP